jgi:hypothetical protein
MLSLVWYDPSHKRMTTKPTLLLLSSDHNPQHQQLQSHDHTSDLQFVTRTVIALRSLGLLRVPADNMSESLWTKLGSNNLISLTFFTLNHDCWQNCNPQALNELCQALCQQLAIRNIKPLRQCMLEMYSVMVTGTPQATFSQYEGLI